MQHEKSRLEAVSSRLDVAKQKVTKVAGSTKATVVHSSAKYPAPNFLEDYTPLYADMLAASAKHSHYHLSATPHVRIIQPRVILNSFFIKLLGPSIFIKDPLLDEPFLPESAPHQEKEEDVQEGLGRIPPTSASISSLLLFNTQVECLIPSCGLGLHKSCRKIPTRNTSP